MQLSLAELGPRIGAEVRGDGALCVTGVAELSAATPDQLAFYSNAKYKKDLAATRAGAVIVAAADEALVPAGSARLIAAQAYVAFAKVSAIFHHDLAVEAGIQRGALVDESAQVHETAAVAPGAYVGPGARIGPRTTLHAGARVLDCAVIGEGCTLYPGAVVRERCIIGDRVILQPNCVIGSDGFGFAFDMEGDGQGPVHRKVPQAGIVRIEDDVEVGACTCIDRATLGETVIGRGTKIDNLVQIGHNVKVGALSLIIAQVGISGSTELGMGVVLAGQVGVAGHIKIGDGARVGGQSGVFNDLEPGVTVSGTPTRPQGQYLRSLAVLPHLPELVKEVRKLTQRVQELELRAKERT
ncbi:MAG TPA: UDP-3-O-(3-hydroxymyristoyl)glucosamine N-acyltransferase [Myxococcales bacterium]|jgi:UDP-3-O-[3-hydroxymyristoyl] glucosamine N-acyltransferase|nr:UDP-3-O-(3-hydroxymyristoyl)glucosamine N-acyltransferase [Myxococcales bacterium]